MGKQYVESHIPGAIPFNLNIATYPTWLVFNLTIKFCCTIAEGYLFAARNERQALYPAELFAQYVQRLGVNQGDLIVIYARGPLGGMLHAARAWFLFRVFQFLLFMFQ